jgi:histidinol-phosphate aminotransferase
MHIKTYKFFNQLTQQAMLDHIDGYVDKSQSISHEIIKLKSRFGTENIYRFDLGENVDGFSPNIQNLYNNPFRDQNLFNKLNEYPSITHRQLRHKIAQLHNLQAEYIVLSTGLDSIIDLITRVFFEYNDWYAMSVPDFFLFEKYSERMGAKPVFIQLDEEDNYVWTDKTIEQFKNSIIRFRPKIVWLSNPNNPSGQIIPKDTLLELIKICHSYNVFIVIDEAYGEYVSDKEVSAIKHIEEYKNLMVLKTFSKAYGLAGIRLGYLITSSKDIVRALLLHRHHFPASQLAQKFASVALDDQNFILRSIKNNEKRKEILFKNLSKLETFHFIPSISNIFMLKNEYLTDDKLNFLLKEKGIFTSLQKINGILNKNFLRLTVRSEDDNEYLYNKCVEIEQEIKKSIIINKPDLNFVS